MTQRHWLWLVLVSLSFTLDVAAPRDGGALERSMRWASGFVCGLSWVPLMRLKADRKE